LLVSVIITTYCRPHLLKQCIQSVVSQSYQNIEIIVVDDGTPGDDNEKVCSGFQNVYYIKIPNSGGPARPRNVGAKNAKGELIAFLDDDDQWLPHKIAQQVEILEQNTDFDLVHSPMQVMDESGQLQNQICGIPGSEDYKHGWVWERMVGNFTLMMPTVLLRKKLFDKADGFNEFIAPGFEDIEFWTRCAYLGKFYYQNTVSSLYRSSKGSLSDRNPLLVHQPLFIYRGLVLSISKGIIKSNQLPFIRTNLALDQVRRLQLGFATAFLNLFFIDIFWLLRKRVIKSFVLELYRILFTKRNSNHADR
jgi:glycosyltransferase involved in cell wall biosynthesis